MAIGDFATEDGAEEAFFRITGIPFAETIEVQARVRMMHAGPKLLEGLHNLLSATGSLPVVILTGPLSEALQKAQAAIAEATDDSIGRVG